MTEYFTVYREEIIGTIIAIVVLFLIRILLFKTIKKVGKIGDIDRNRTLLILKYIDVFILIVGVITLSLLWGVDFKDLGLFLSSAFAVIGVAFFASWSILSNITAGIILFFSFPFKIGDRIRIQDKDFPSEAIIEDIRAFHLHLRTDDGELITYPNSLMLQKGIVVIDNPQREDDGKSTL
ncbi:mechanosensitive ion channel domain-containing protein [Galbibacter orientalis]|uniref:Small-conductance mechanosensitive channel n=1 Tax=Galbibacter orientalis DSM 19592 TaxID=926559 RepID=I3C9Z0_9FLAO|nr:mechanosensitive ion channel domain-containing protein [Galbibacter orientalis]EIJ40433.1 small-conductance mechanosensitive channel [Galbibacter orientalis DSM 19592]